MLGQDITRFTTRREDPRRRRLRLRSGLLLAVLALGLATTTVACSKSNKATGTQSSAPGPGAQATGAPASSNSGAPQSGVSGKWSGQYGGAFNGTFALTWLQSGSTLTGHIHLSSAGGTVPINGTVEGDSIRFGTVGSTAITYTGSVSGDSMSGTYKVQTASGSVGGHWSAHKTA